MRLKFLFTLILLALVAACGPNEPHDAPYAVQHRGALKNIMRKGDLSAKVELSTFADSAHLYALGAIENLKGEVLVLDGQAYHSSVRGEEHVMDHTFAPAATLLVYAQVKAWQTLPIPSSVVTYTDLETFVAEAAASHGLDTDYPFPFLLKGRPASLDWHIIDWPEGDTEHTHEKHIRSGLHATARDTPVTMLGFYSDRHHAVFTHHTTNMHIHFLTDDRSLAGHVDGLRLQEGMMLSLPLADE
ncbi:MAG: acetolactate decarboxylase [Bacteroidota bacterium]